uniref:Glycosyltransferase 61 catalytic domain-containing protein n=1 Tax=Tetradesmus obliquus TaxID=3088 RepID=A0A383VJH0_TETOB|eukprot:jgi/Sobl393_1/904/SZX64794.1
MPQAYAPCLNYSNLLHGEELVYPDFRIHMPFSINAEHNKTLFNFIKPRFRVEGDWAYYLNQHGRNFVFANTTYENNPLPHWAASCCMCEGNPAPHQQFTPARNLIGSVQQEVMFAASPDSYSFQHWNDRTAMMLTQARHLLSNTTKYIVAPPREHTVATHWQLMSNVTADRLIPPGKVNAAKFIYSCDTPLLHPYLAQRSSEIMLTAAGLDPRGVPWDQRKVVLLINRKQDSGVRNGGERHWNNYDECKQKLQQLLQKRGKGEILEEWDLAKFKSLQDIMRFWNTQVRGAVGVHGGALMNVLWTTPGTVIFEIWPVTADKKRSRAYNLYWEMTALKNSAYWWFHAQSDERWNVNVDCDLLAQAMNTGLTDKTALMLDQFYQGTKWSTR